MLALVAYASRHGATRGIAERVGVRLSGPDLHVDVESIERAGDLARYDAFVLGSAVYALHWRNGARQFIRRNSKLLRQRPVWLFSSGPLGTQTTDAQGQLVEMAGPRELGELEEMAGSRDHRVFSGALDSRTLGFWEQMITAMPTARRSLTEGDFRDWDEVDAWAFAIAAELTSAPATRH